MADILQQLMQLEMQNKGGARSASPNLRPSPFGPTPIGQALSITPTMRPSPFGATSTTEALNLRPSPFGPITQGAPYAQGMSPQATTPPPPPPPEEIFAPSRPDPMYNFSNGPTQEIYAPPTPEVYPQDISPLSSMSQQAQRRYTQDASGNQVEIGYDGQPLSSYSPEQMAIHNATMGITPSQSKYVFNGQGYDLVPNTPQATGVNMDTGGVRLSNGQFIGGYQNPNGGMEIGTPSFFQQYAGNPELMRALSDAYGYDISNPDIVASMQRQPQTGYNEPARPAPTQGNEKTNDMQKMMEELRNQQVAENMRNEQRISLDNPRPPEEILPPIRQYG